MTISQHFGIGITMLTDQLVNGAIQDSRNGDGTILHVHRGIKKARKCGDKSTRAEIPVSGTP